LALWKAATVDGVRFDSARILEKVVPPPALGFGLQRRYKLLFLPWETGTFCRVFEWFVVERNCPPWPFRT
jgi:hypothetical protein